ncbi:MAG TPA: hypothetical protein PKA13_11520 [Geminicoccaceae bacterium]|nr:hypothetical protein [Geminicoccus sp.]HMU50394.1 hypothetical protein [Geminicoccaceae bacterium]
MAEVTLEFIGAQLSRLVDGQRQMIETLGDMKARLQAVETGLVDLRRDVVNLHGDVVRLDHRLDGVDTRLGRIEWRLDLVEA